MDIELITWIFIGGGLSLMLLELLIPSGMAFLLGLSGLLVGLVQLLGFFEDPVNAVMAWLFTSVALTIAVRPVIKKYFQGETSFKFADEDFEAMDQIVEVVEPLNDSTNEGRIRFQGISWQARTIDGEVPVGAQVRIKYRDNTTWIVEPVTPISPTSNQQLKQSNEG